MRVLLTGGGGFCGRHLLAFLKARAVETHTVGRHATTADHHRPLADPTDTGALTDAVRAIRPDAVLHLAGVARGVDPTAYFTVNAAYAAHLLDALAAAGCADAPVLLVGTSAEYGPVGTTDLPIVEELRAAPRGLYGISKLAQTLLGLAAAADGRRVVIARPFNIVGPGMPEHLVIGTFARQIAHIARGDAPPVLAVGRLDTARDFVDVADAVAAYWDLLCTPAAHGQIVNVCSGRGTTVQSVLDGLCALAGVAPEIRVDPARLRGLDIPVHYGSPRKLAGLVGYTPATPFATSLARIYEEEARACVKP